MGATTMFAAVSLDGFIADDNDDVGPLFDWYYNGDTDSTFSDEERVFNTTPETAEFLQRSVDVACIVQGRRLFDITNGWEGRPAAGDHVFVVTHEPPADWEHTDTAPFTFVTEGVEKAIEPRARVRRRPRHLRHARRRRRPGPPARVDRPGGAQPRAGRLRHRASLLRHRPARRAGDLRRPDRDRPGQAGHPPALRPDPLTPLRPAPHARRGEEADAQIDLRPGGVGERLELRARVVDRRLGRDERVGCLDRAQVVTVDAGQRAGVRTALLGQRGRRRDEVVVDPASLRGRDERLEVGQPLVEPVGRLAGDPREQVTDRSRRASSRSRRSSRRRPRCSRRRGRR